MSVCLLCYKCRSGGGPPGAAPSHTPPAREALLVREPERQRVYFFLPHWNRLGQQPEPRGSLWIWFSAIQKGAGPLQLHRHAGRRVFKVLLRPDSNTTGQRCAEDVQSCILGEKEPACTQTSDLRERTCHNNSSSSFMHHKHQHEPFCSAALMVAPHVQCLFVNVIEEGFRTGGLRAGVPPPDTLGSRGVDPVTFLLSDDLIHQLWKTFQLSLMGERTQIFITFLVF